MLCEHHRSVYTVLKEHPTSQATSHYRNRDFATPSFSKERRYKNTNKARINGGIGGTNTAAAL